MMNLQALVTHAELIQKNLAEVAQKMERGEGFVLSSQPWKDAQAALRCLLAGLLDQPNNVARTRAALALLREAADVIASPSMQGHQALERIAKDESRDLTNVAAWLVERKG